MDKKIADAFKQGWDDCEAGTDGLTPRVVGEDYPNYSQAQIDARGGSKAMIFRKQRRETCMLSSVCQLRPDLDHDTLAGSFEHLMDNIDGFAEGWRIPVLQWAENNNVPEIETILGVYSQSAVQIKGYAPREPAPNLSGRGIIIIRYWLGSHAMSYDNGMVLDPDGDGKEQTWEDYTARDHPSSWWVVQLEE